MGAGASVTDLAIEVESTNVEQFKARRDASVVEILCATNLDLLLPITCTSGAGRKRGADSALSAGTGEGEASSSPNSNSAESEPPSVAKPPVVVETHEDVSTQLKAYVRCWLTTDAPGNAHEEVVKGTKVSTETTEKTVNPAFYAFRSLETVADPFRDTLHFELVHRGNAKDPGDDRVLKHFSVPLSAVSFGLGDATGVVVTVGLSNATHSKTGCDLLAHPGQGPVFDKDRPAPASRSAMVAMAEGSDDDDTTTAGGDDNDDGADDDDDDNASTATAKDRRRRRRQEKHPISRARSQSPASLRCHRAAAITAGCPGSGLLLVNGAGTAPVWEDQYPFPTFSFVLHSAPKGGWPQKKTLFLIRHAESLWNEAIRTKNIAKLFAFDHPLVPHGIGEALELRRLWSSAAADEEFDIAQKLREQKQKQKQKPIKTTREGTAADGGSSREGETKAASTKTAHKSVTQSESTESTRTDGDDDSEGTLEEDDDDFSRRKTQEASAAQAEADLLDENDDSIAHERHERFVLQPENDVQRFMGADVVFASPLTRAMQTAMIVLEDHHAVRHGGGIVALKSMRERKTRVGWDSVGKVVGEDIAARCEACFDKVARKGEARSSKTRAPATAGNATSDPGDVVAGDPGTNTSFKSQPSSPLLKPNEEVFGPTPRGVRVDPHDCRHIWWKQRDDYDKTEDLHVRIADFLSTVQFFPSRSNATIAVGHSLWIREFCKAYTGLKVVRAKPKLVQDMVTWKLNNAGCLKLELTFFGKRGTRITDASLLFGSQFARNKNALAVRNLPDGATSPSRTREHLVRTLPSAAAEKDDVFSDEEVLDEDDDDDLFMSGVVAGDGTNLRDLDEDDEKNTGNESIAPTRSPYIGTPGRRSSAEHTAASGKPMEATSDSSKNSPVRKKFQPQGDATTTTNGQRVRSGSFDAGQPLAHSGITAPLPQKKGPRDRSNSQVGGRASSMMDQGVELGRDSRSNNPSTPEAVTAASQSKKAAASTAEAAAAEAAEAAAMAAAAAAAVVAESKLNTGASPRRREDGPATPKPRTPMAGPSSTSAAYRPESKVPSPGKQHPSRTVGSRRSELASSEGKRDRSASPARSSTHSRLATPPIHGPRSGTPPRHRGTGESKMRVKRIESKQARAANKAKREAKRLARLQHMQEQQRRLSTSPSKRQWNPDEGDDE